MVDKIIKECCVNDLSDALIAQKNGADRIELCAEIVNGGVTPSYGTIKNAKEILTIPVNVILRPRGGNFVYSEIEKKLMLDDAKMIKDLKCDGLVCGALLDDGSIDIEFIRKIIELVEGSMTLTFHMAFDFIENKIEAISILKNLGFQRILTRGGITGSAITNSKSIKEYMLIANEEITILPGGGITSQNLSELAKDLQPFIKEAHGTKIVTKI